MTARIEKTVFISYRRTNYWTALAVFQNLNANGYDVFLDYRSIPSGDFEQVITENVKSRAHFVVILSPSALERCHEPGDWFRREIETAFESKRNVIPLMMEGFDFGSPATVDALTGKLTDLKKYNGLSIPAEYFEEAMLKLRGDRFLNRPLESIYHPVSDITKQITEEQKSAAFEATPIEKEQLNAQEWFERGYMFGIEGNFDEAIRCFTESINLEPKNPIAFYNRGLERSEMGDLDGALQDYNDAILIMPDLLDAYYNRALTLYTKGDLDGAIQDYQEIIFLKPDATAARSSLMSILRKLGWNTEADEQEKLVREVIYKENEYTQAGFESLCGNIDQALELLKIGLEKNQSSKSWARQDPDFENICNDLRFKAIVGE